MVGGFALDFFVGAAAIERGEGCVEEGMEGRHSLSRIGARGQIFRVDLAAIESGWQIGTSSGEIAPAAHKMKIADRVMQLSVSPDGARLAFCTDSRSEREETLDTYSIFAIEIGAGGEALGQPQVVSHTQVIYDHIHWANDSRHIFLFFSMGLLRARIRTRSPASIGWTRGRWHEAVEWGRATFALGCEFWRGDGAFRCYA